MSEHEEARLVQYLLGGLPPAEREKVEDQYFADSECFTTLQALEDELIRDYVCRGLSPQQIEQFETRLTTDWALRERVCIVQAAKGLLGGEVPAVSVDRLPRLRSLPSRLRDVALLAACIVIVVAGAGTLVLLRTWNRLDLVQQKLDASIERQKESRRGEESGTLDPTFSLVAGVARSRGSGEQHALVVSPKAQMVHLEFLLPSIKSGFLRVSLRSADSRNEIWSIGVPSSNQLSVAIPAGLFEAGDYILSATTADGEGVESWSFRIIR